MRTNTTPMRTRGAEQPQRGKVGISLYDLAMILDMPDKYDPQFMYVDPETQTLFIVFDGAELASHPDNRYMGNYAPQVGFYRERVRDGEGNISDKLVWCDPYIPGVTPDSALPQ